MACCWTRIAAKTPSPPHSHLKIEGYTGRGHSTRLLGLLRRGRDARPDGPDGLVGDDDARLVLERLQDRDDVLELAHALGEDGVDALLADGQRLADAEDAGEAVLEDVRELGGHERVRLRGRGQAELAAALAVADEHRVHAHVLDLVHGHLARVGAAAAEVAVLRRDLDACGGRKRAFL